MGLSAEAFDRARRDLRSFLRSDPDGSDVLRLRDALLDRRAALLAVAERGAREPGWHGQEHTIAALDCAMAVLYRLARPSATRHPGGRMATGPASASELDADEVSLLVELGFLAWDDGDADTATRLFASLAALGPSNPYPRIGLAIVAHGRGRLADAIAWLQDVVSAHPRSAAARGLLSRFLMEADRPGWERHALRILELAPQGTAATLARHLLGRPGAVSAAKSGGSRRTAVAAGARGA